MVILCQRMVSATQTSCQSMVSATILTVTFSTDQLRFRNSQFNINIKAVFLHINTHRRFFIR
jgi:hypothetical protein